MAKKRRITGKIDPDMAYGHYLARKLEWKREEERKKKEASDSESEKTEKSDRLTE